MKTVGSIGGFLGPYAIGLLASGGEDYASSMALLASCMVTGGALCLALPEPGASVLLCPAGAEMRVECGLRASWLAYTTRSSKLLPCLHGGRERCTMQRSHKCAQGKGCRRCRGRPCCDGGRDTSARAQTWGMQTGLCSRSAPWRRCLLSSSQHACKTADVPLAA